MNPIIIESEKFCKAISFFFPVGAITLCPFIICRDKSRVTMLNHEFIHIKQQLELLVLPFFTLYLFNWIYNLIKFKGDSFKAYSEIIFEKEAYANEDNPKYLEERLSWSYFRN